jgi:hypothetical protein
MRELQHSQYIFLTQTYRFRFVYPLATLYTMLGKDAGLRIRVEKALREEFLEACRSQDRPAAQVLREFMRRYVARHADEEDKKAIQIPPFAGLDHR